jgi:glycosyltransferase involved in cell wall biosynthesis
VNIVFLNDSGSVNGGAAKVALSETRAMAEAGHTVHLVCGTGPIDQDLVGVPNLTVHCMDFKDVNEDPNRLRAMTFGWWNPRSYKYVRDLLESMDRRDTVVHVHSWTRALSSSAVKAATDAGCAVVVTLHDYLLACPQGTFFVHKTQKRCTLTPMSPACLMTDCDATSYANKLWRTGRKVVQSTASAMPSGVRHYIGLSRTSMALIEPFLPRESTFHSLPNPIDVAYHEASAVSEVERFLFVGRLVPEKGAVLFAKAASAAGVPVQFIGEGPEREDVTTAYPAAVMSGWMGHRDVLEAMRSVRALVFPSLWYEVMPLTVLEAAAFGVPSIVPRGCAAEESVVDGVTGLDFVSGDEADLRAKIEMLKDPETARRMGAAAHARFWASTQLTMKVHGPGLERIYREMLKTPLAYEV